MSSLIELATPADIPAWLALADEVGELFGADMAHDPAFHAWLLRSIARDAAFCVRVDGRLAGAMQFRQDCIHWLAVGRAFQRRGIGRALVAYALMHCVHEVRVTTFGLDHPHPGAAAARSLYQVMGFQLTEEPVAPAADGRPRVILVWRPE